LPPNQRLAYIGKTDEVDIKSVIKNVNAPMSEEDKKKWEALHTEVNEVLGEEEQTDEAADVVAEYVSIRDIATTRVFLEEFDNVERIDKMIVAAESRCNAFYRELDRHRASLASQWREKIRNIEEADFKVIKPEKLRANGRKSAA
jgi:thioesterase domain-containing protein